MSSALSWLLSLFLPNSTSPDEANRKFLREFESVYSVSHPRFTIGSFANAVSQAKLNSKLLITYFHAPLHEDCDQFCDSVICSNEFMTLVDERFLCWAGSVYDEDGYNVLQQLHATGFPYIAVFECTGERSVKVIDRMQGITDVRIITRRLEELVVVHTRARDRERELTESRRSSMSLRQQQDLEYEQAMEQDRQAMLAQEEKERLEMEAQQQQELNEAIELSKQLDHISLMQRKKELLPPEPITGGATIRFQLPSSSNDTSKSKPIKLTRKFNYTDTVQVS